MYIGCIWSSGISTRLTISLIYASCSIVSIVVVYVIGCLLSDFCTKSSKAFLLTIGSEEAMMQPFDLFCIFNPIQPINTSEQLKKLRPYMGFTKGSVANATFTEQPITIRETPQQQQQPITVREVPQKPTLFNITQPNSLFWAIYILVNGRKAVPHQSKLANFELDEHVKILNWLKANPTAIKQRFPKVTKVLCEEIYSDLLVGKMNNPLLIYAYCTYYKKAVVVFVSDKIYCQYGTPIEEDEVPLYLYLTVQKRYDIVLGNVLLHSPNFRETMLAIEKVNEPIKAITHYKVADLVEMATKLSCELPEKAKKAQIYEAVQNILIRHLM
jgi:hypothetical protein